MIYLKLLISNFFNKLLLLIFLHQIQSMTPFALDLNFLIEEYAAEKGHYPPRKRRRKNSMYICTIEKAQSVVNCLIELNRLDEVFYFII